MKTASGLVPPGDGKTSPATREEDRLLAWIDLSFDPAAVLDCDGRCVAANESFHAQTGCCPGDDVIEVMDSAGRYSLRKLLDNPTVGDRAFTCRVVASPARPVSGGRNAENVNAPTRAGDVSLRAHAGPVLIPGRGTCLAVFLQPLGADAPASVRFGEQTGMAMFDPLTGLPNRALLNDRLEVAIARARRFKTHGAVFFIDLDGFKPINDLHGHDCGDEVLRVVAERLRACTRKEDTAARIGGDEFVVVASELNLEIHAGLVAGKLVRQIVRPIDWRGGALKVGASVGVAVFPADGDTPDELLTRADEAMYSAKRAGKNGYAFFDESRLV